MSPKYTLNPVLENPAIEPGESINIELYLSGWGRVSQNKLVIQSLATDLIDSTNPGAFRRSIGYAPDPESWTLERMSPTEYMESEGTEGVPTLEQRTEELDPRVMIINFLPSFFMTHHDWIAPEGEYPPQPQTDHPEITSQFTLPALTTEMTPEESPPMELIINTQDDCPPGDYVIRLIFTYTNKNGDIYQEKEEIRIHVKTPREILEPIPTIAGIIAVGIALISLGWQISSVLGLVVLFLVSGVIILIYYLYNSS